MKRNKQLVALALASAVSVQASPILGASPGQGGQSQATASLAGTSINARGAIVSNVKVQLRDITTGRLVATTRSDATGVFSFTGVHAGNYAIGVVNGAGGITGTSGSIAVTPGERLSGLTATSAGQAPLVAPGAGAGVGLSTALIVTGVAAAAGIAALVITRPKPSPSQ